MGLLDRFSEPASERREALGTGTGGVDWYAMVQCQTCGVEVDEQTLFPLDKVLVWTCPEGHDSMIEGFSIF